jgi:hypothetical protein
VTVTLTEPATLTATETHGSIACHSGTAAVTIGATGGTPANTGTGTFQQGVGSHTYTVTDANQCSSSVTVTLTEPGVLSLALTVDQPTCSGNDGKITGVPSGGTGPFQYSKNGGGYQNSADFLGLAPGSYTIGVKDASDCTASASATLNNPFCNGHILPTGTTCSQYQAASVADLPEICFNLRGNKIGNVNPGVFFYYTKIVAPSSSFTVDIGQSVTLPGTLFPTQSDQVIVYDTSCTRLQTVVVSSSGGQVTMQISNAVAGQTYIISVKYSTGIVVGQTATKNQTWKYDFRTSVNTVVVDGTKNSLILKNCK